MTPADITLQQLGGSRRLKLMVNGRDFHSKNNGYTLAFKFSGSKSMNWVEITISSMDLYDLRFFKIPPQRGEEFKPPILVEEIRDVYNDQLMDVFKEATGLYLTIGRRV